MRSVKLDDDVDELLTAMRGHRGRTKSDVVRSLIHEAQMSEVQATKVCTQVRLTYETVTRIEQRLEDKTALSAPTYKVE